MGIILVFAGAALYSIGVITGVYVGYSMKIDIDKRPESPPSKKDARKY